MKNRKEINVIHAHKTMELAMGIDDQRLEEIAKITHSFINNPVFSKVLESIWNCKELSNEEVIVMIAKVSAIHFLTQDPKALKRTMEMIENGLEE